jgi:hypothetical protein
MLDINIRITTALVKYDFNRIGHVSQLRYNQEVVINLPNSRVTPITTTGINAEENMAVRPNME